MNGWNGCHNGKTLPNSQGQVSNAASELLTLVSNNEDRLEQMESQQRKQQYQSPEKTNIIEHQHIEHKQFLHHMYLI